MNCCPYYDLVPIYRLLLYEHTDSVEPLDAQTKWNPDVTWGRQETPLTVRVGARKVAPWNNNDGSFIGSELSLSPPPVGVPIVPPMPLDSVAAFDHVLCYIVGLDTQQKRDCVTVRGGVTTIDDILLVDIEGLLDCLPKEVSITVRSHLKTLKIWAEEQYKINGTINVDEFTNEVCRTNLMKMMHMSDDTTSFATHRDFEVASNRASNEVSPASLTLLYYKLALPGVPTHITEVLKFGCRTIQISAIIERINRNGSFLAQHGRHYAYIISSGINHDDVLNEWDIWERQSHGGSQNNPLLITAYIPTTVTPTTSKYIVIFSYMIGKRCACTCQCLSET